MSLATDHFGTTFYRFPEDNGVDMTRLPNYPEPTSIFAYRAVHDFFGAYDSGDDRGIVQTADHRELPGKKGWTWGQGDDGMMNQRALTDEDGPYIEVQSGPLPTQSDYAWVFPGQRVFWREEWTPVFGLGEGFEYATPDLVVERVEDDGGTRFLFLATRALPGADIRLSSGGTAHSTTLDLVPEAVATVEWPGPPAASIEVAVTADGGTVLAYRSPLEIPTEEPPPLLEATEPANAEEAFLAAERADKDLNRAEARRLYERALVLAPGHPDAAVGLAALDLKAGLYERAADRLAAVAAADPEHGFARFLHAVARYRLGDDEGALDSAYLATKLAGVEAPAWRLIGRVKVRQGNAGTAVPAFRRSSRDLLPLALLRAGDEERAAGLAGRMIERGTVELVPWAVRLHTADGPGRAEAARAMTALAGEPEFAFTELLVTLAELGLGDVALEVLDGLRGDGGFEPGPVLLFHAAEWASGERARRYRDEALAAPLDYAFPSRPESLAVLRSAAEHLPASATPRLLLGHLLAGLGRFEEATAAWEAATALDPGLSTAHRALGMVHWKIAGRSAEAESRLRQAIAARPADQTLYRDLARLLLAEGRPADAVQALRDGPGGRAPPPRRHHRAGAGPERHRPVRGNDRHAERDPGQLPGGRRHGVATLLASRGRTRPPGARRRRCRGGSRPLRPGAHLSRQPRRRPFPPGPGGAGPLVPRRGPHCTRPFRRGGGHADAVCRRPAPERRTGALHRPLRGRPVGPRAKDRPARWARRGRDFTGSPAPTAAARGRDPVRT